MLEASVEFNILTDMDIVELAHHLGNVKYTISFQQSWAVSTLMANFRKADMMAGMQATAHVKARLVGCAFVADGQGLGRNEATKTMDQTILNQKLDSSVIQALGSIGQNPFLSLDHWLCQVTVV